MRPFLFTLAALAAALLLAGTLTLPRLPYLGFAMRGNRVALVDAGSAARQAGLKSGDELLQAWVSAAAPPTGQGPPARQVAPTALRSFPRGTAVGLIVASPARPAHTVFFTLAAPPPAESVRRWLSLLTAAIFLAVGTFTCARRPDALGRTFFLLCLAFTLIFVQPVAPADPRVTGLMGLLDDLSVLLLGASLVHFVLLFPRPVEQARRRRTLTWVYGGAGGLALVTLASTLGLPLLPVVEALAGALAALYLVACLGATLVLFVRSLRRAASPADALRLRVVQWGTILALGPLLPVMLLRNLLPAGGLPGDQFAVLSVSLLPLSYMYAIVRHQIFDIRIIVRRGVIYFLLTAVLALLYFGLIMGLGPRLDPREGHPGVAFLSLGLIALLFTSMRGFVQGMVDRLFFAGDRSRRERLTQLSGRVATMVDSERLCATLYHDLAEGLDAESAALYRVAGQGRRLELAAWRNGQGAAAGYDAAARPGTPPPEGGPPAVLPLPAPLRALVQDLARPARAEDLLEASAPDDRAGLAERLKELRFDLFVPLRDGPGLFAVVALKAVRSGPDSRELALLERIAQDASRALTQARGREDEMERERLAGELDVARRIQEHLLPAEPPLSPLVELAGTTLACEAVGGDSHDYVRLPDGRIGFAVGDVSGKGVPAAILMASTQASFRAEAELGRTPGPLLATLNRRLLEIHEPARFVCFFYALIDPVGLTLRFANSGLEPPILVRADGTDRDLVEGGPVLGVLTEAEYEEGCVALEPGDVIVAFSDGLTDGRTPEEIPLERERIPDLVRAHRDAGAEALRRVLLREAGLLTAAGAAGPPSDDVTLVIARIY